MPKQESKAFHALSSEKIKVTPETLVDKEGKRVDGRPFEEFRPICQYIELFSECLVILFFLLLCCFFFFCSELTFISLSMNFSSQNWYNKSSNWLWLHRDRRNKSSGCNVVILWL